MYGIVHDMLIYVQTHKCMPCTWCVAGGFFDFLIENVGFVTTELLRMVQKFLEIGYGFRLKKSFVFWRNGFVCLIIC